MIRFLFVFSLAIWLGGFTGAQDFYGPDHEGMRYTLWRADGEQFATWGTSPYVYVWRDHDGLRLMELDHRRIMRVASDHDFVMPNAFISDVRWSGNGQVIVTRAHPQRPDHHVHEQAWSAESGELLYSYVIKAFHPHGLNRNLHKPIEGEDLVFSWAYDQLALIDVNPKSATVGRTLRAIDFEDKVIVRLSWSVDSSMALLKLRGEGELYCETCPTTFKLVDTDLTSDTFGETLWQTGTLSDAQAYLWHNAADLLALHNMNKIELWNLDRASPAFGTLSLRIDLSHRWFHSLLWNANNQRLIVIEKSNMDYVETAHPDAGPRCHDENCEFHIGVWDVDPGSARFGQQIATIAHQYPDNNSRNRVAFNESERQLHIKTYALISTDPTWEWDVALTAYDAHSGERVEARDIAPEPKAKSEGGRRFPDVDRSRIPDDFIPIAVNPSGTKVMTMNCEVFPCLHFIFDVRTGEWLLPKMAG